MQCVLLWTGTLPPFGHATTIPVIVDIRLALHLPSKAASLAALPDLNEVNLNKRTAPTNAASQQTEAGMVSSTSGNPNPNDLSKVHSSTEPGLSITSNHDSSTSIERSTPCQNSISEESHHLLYCGSGASNAIIECTALQLLAMSNGSLADITDSPATLSPIDAPAATASSECAGSHTSSCSEWMQLASVFLPGVRFLQSEAGAARQSALQAANGLRSACASTSPGPALSTEGCPGDSSIISGGSVAAHVATVKQAGGNTPVGHGEGLLVFVVRCIT